MFRAAVFSDCKVYRYLLIRKWSDDLFKKDEKLKIISWIMLNPSTADEYVDDATIRRCISFSKKWGYDALHIFNIFALRSTDPKVLKIVDDPIGVDNDYYLKELTTRSEKIVIAWGNHAELNGRGQQVLEILADRKLFCLGNNKSGHPKHPLYVPQKTKLVEYKNEN